MFTHFFVFHKNVASFCLLGTPEKCDRKDYSLAAIVEVEHQEKTNQASLLEIPFAQTNHVESDWRNNEGVIAFGDKPLRSTSVGDIVAFCEKDNFNKISYWFCDVVGWKKVSF